MTRVEDISLAFFVHSTEKTIVFGIEIEINEGKVIRSKVFLDSQGIVNERQQANVRLYFWSSAGFNQKETS